MKKWMKRWLLALLFTAGGALAGLAYYTFVGCPTGTCPITSSPASTMLYTGMIGWLISYVIVKHPSDT